MEGDKRIIYHNFGDLMKQSIKVGVFIINYNGLSSLGNILFKCIESIIAQRIRYPFLDIWFVDNGSSDKSYNAICKKYGSLLKCIKISRNLGYGVACNLAYLYSKNLGYRYDVVIFSNNDIVLYEDAIVKIIERISKLNTNLFIASVFLVNGFDEKIDYGGSYLDEILNSWSIRIVFEKPEVISLISRVVKVIPVHYTDGAFIIMSTLAFERIGMFNEWLFMYYDDVELSLRACMKNIKLFMLPIVVGVHYRSSSFKKIPSTLVYFCIRNQVYLTLKYLGKIAFVKLILWYITSVVRILQSKLLGVKYGVPFSFRRVQSFRVAEIFRLAPMGVKAAMDGVKLYLRDLRGMKVPRKRSSIMVAELIKLGIGEFINVKALINKVREQIMKQIIVSNYKLRR